MLKIEKLIIYIFSVSILCTLSSNIVWATPQDIDEKYKELDQKVKTIEEQIDKVSIGNVVKAYKDSESSLYEASSKSISLANYIIIGIGALTAIKYTKDTVESKKMKEFMDNSKKEFDAYQTSVKVLEEKIKKYEEEIDNSKKEIDDLKINIESYADKAEHFAKKSELENLKNTLNINSESYDLNSNRIDKTLNLKNPEKNLSYEDRSTLFNKVRSLEESGDLASAIDCYKELIKIDSENPGYYYTRIADLYRKLFMDEEFLKYIALAEREEDSLSYALFIKGIYYGDNDDYEKAIDCLKKSLELDEDYTTYNILGFVSEKQGNYEDAQYYYKKGSELKNNISKLVSVTNE